MNAGTPYGEFGDTAVEAEVVGWGGRLTMLPTLALASRLAPEGAPAHADRARRWLADFTAKNPLGHGVHHTSGIEMAVRTLTIGWTLAQEEVEALKGELARLRWRLDESTDALQRARAQHSGGP